MTRVRPRIALSGALAALASFALLALASPASAQIPPRCDDFDPSVCLQPFPNDFFTVRDRQTDTGRRVDFDLLAMPHNAAGKPIDPTEWNRNDGFSPGSLITLHIPGLDNPRALNNTGGVPISNLQASYDANAPIVVLDADTLQRQLIWTELDSNASSDSVRNLIIRPAANLAEGHRYIVALRDLKDSNGSSIPAPAAFASYRDRPSKGKGAAPYEGGTSGRAAHMESIFRTLAQVGIDRSSLYLAWDFTVASEQSLSQRMLQIRSDAFGQLGERPDQLATMRVPTESRPPRFVVTSVQNYAPGSGPLARQVQGRFYVPCYLLTPGCQPGGGFYYPPGSQLPGQLPGNTYEGKFTCNIPWAATQAPARPSLYGHGLFGSRGEVNQGQLKAMANEHDFVFCATEEIGMACAADTPAPDPTQLLAEAQKGLLPETPDCDIPNVATVIADLSRFNTMIDRLQEGLLAELYLGRLMVHPQGFASDPAFQWNGQPVIDTSRLYYDGNSQGGILGGAAAALMVDGDRATLGVPGMNYSTLLQRSTDFGRGSPDEGPPTNTGIPSYAWLIYHAYPTEADRQVLFGLLQMLWDRGEADGYAEHMTTNPLPDTPAHTVLMHVAFGDHQVSDWAAAVEARTIGADLHTPAIDTFRDPLGVGGSTFFGAIPAIPSYPWPGSAIVVWDSGPIRNGCSAGNGPPPFPNTPPIAGCPAGVDPSQWGGNDPHEEPRNTVAARQQKSDFAQPNGVVNDVCNGLPCYSRGWNGAP